MTPPGPSDVFNNIFRQFDRVRRKSDRIDFLFGVQATLLIALAVVLAATVSEEVLRLGTTGRTILFYAAVAGIAGAAMRFLGPPVLRMSGLLPRISRHEIARIVGAHFPAVHDRLLDALQLYEQRENSDAYYSVSLIDASVADLNAQIEGLNFPDAVSDRRLRSGRKFVWYAFAVAALVLLVSPSGFFTSLYRLSHYEQTFAAPLDLRISVEPGDVNAIRGQSVRITVHTEGRPVSAISLLTRMEGEAEFETVEMGAAGGVFQTELKNLKSTTEYYAGTGEVRSDKYRITVLDRPLLRVFRLTATPPAYTHLPRTTGEDNNGDISVYPGTTIGVELQSSKPLTGARLVFADTTTAALTVKGAFATGAFRVKKNSTYHFSLRDQQDLENLDAVEYTIRLLSDAAPTVEIVAPGKNMDITESMRIDLLLRIRDDFGFSKLRLNYRLAQSRYEQPSQEFTSIDVPLPGGQTTQADIQYAWDLSPMHLVPEDAIAYYAEVFDNDNVNGPKAGRSETYILRLPSLEEVFSDVSQSHEQSSESMQNISKEAEQLRKDLDDLQRDLRKNPQRPDWQQQKKSEELVQRYQELQKKVADVSQRLDETMKKMDDNKLLSDETMQKYSELRKLMEQINSPELQDALKKLQQSMKQLSPEQMQQALAQLKMSEEQFRQSLERTIELLKRIHIEQKLDELIKRTQELGKRQEELQSQTKSTSSSDQTKRSELAKQQEDLKQQSGSLNKETADLSKKMEEFPEEMPVEEMSQAQKQLEQSNLEQQMTNAGKQLSSGDMQNAGQQQEQTKKDLSEFEQQLQAVQKSMRENQMKQVMEGMRKQVRDLLELSKQEEGIKDETKGLDPNSRRFRESMQHQDDVRSGLNSVANQLNELGKKTFAVSPEISKEMGNAMRSMDEAMKQMEARQPGTSSLQQGEAMGSLNRAAMLMQSAINGMMQGGQGGSGMSGLLGQLSQLSGQQGGINQGTRDAMGMGQGQGLSAEQQAAYERLAGRQAAVQKTMQQLAEEAKNTGDFSKLLGDLNKIADEMQEVQTDLEQQNVTPETTQKQERILSRLLDSQRSMRERDYEKRRKSESGKTVPRVSPGEIDLTTQEGKNKLREELLRVLESKYSKDYETLIKKYFEELDRESADQH